MKSKAIWAAAAATALLIGAGASLHAIEISLEQNRTDHSSIGFVDMQRLFQAFPETKRAKESFQEVVEKTQEQLNQQKAEILRLQNKLADLQLERQALVQDQVPAMPTPAAAPPPLQATPVAVPAAQPAAPVAPLAVAKASSTAVSTVLLSSAPAAAPRVSTAAAAAPASYAVKASSVSVFQALPGVPSQEIVPTPPPVPVKAAASVPAVAISSRAAQAVVAASTAPVSVPLTQLSATVRQEVASLDSQIALTDQELKRDQAQYGDREAAAEKNLIDLEGNKTDMLLGEINRAIEIVADQEDISVVVDKGNILYGHDAVDLTDKVLKQLGKMR